MAPRIATTKVPTSLVTALARVAGTVDGLESAKALEKVDANIRGVLTDLRNAYNEFSRAGNAAGSTDDSADA